MKPLSTDDMARLADRMFPDDAQLMAFHAVHEIRNGKLHRICLKGRSDMADDPEAEIVAFIGRGHLSENCMSFRVFTPSPQRERVAEELTAWARTLPAADPDPNHRISTTLHVAALLAVIELPDGQLGCFLYRHPEVDEHEVGPLVRLALDHYERRDAEKAANAC